MNPRRIAELAGLLTLMPLLAGCPVPQPPGNGRQQIVREPRTGGEYFLYLPDDYVKNEGRHPLYPDRKWPLVMTFHGMKPYDTWDRQAHEWEQEADNYGYIVCAPWLQTSDSFMEYPLRREHDYVLKDKERVIAIMDHVFETTRADPNAVLSTAFSCGGYLAHYFPNRFPKRFHCIATRLSNFSSDLLLEENVPLYRRVPVAIYIGDGDFAACKAESERAVAWYRTRGFRTTGKTIDDLGHVRTPQCAAAFFAESLGIHPLHPERAARSLAQVRMTDYQPPPEMLATVAPRIAPGAMPPRLGPTASAAPADPGSSVRPLQVPAPRGSLEPPRSSARNDAANRGFDPRLAYATPRNADGADLGGVPPTAAAAVATAGRRADATDLDPVRVAHALRGTAIPAQSGMTDKRAATSASGSAQQSPRATAAGIRAESPAPLTPPRQTPRPYRPSQAGPEYYPSERLARQSLEPLAPAGRTAEPASEPAALTVLSAARGGADDVAEEGAVSRPPVRTARIVLTGDPVGTAPYYLSFRVDLPPEVLGGADFLWLDNGMWICDEPRGVKILDTPGIHRITVLVLTKSGEEYRGATNIQVLGRGPADRPRPQASLN